MRWDNLFDDLESQLEQGLSAEEIDLQAEEERLRLGRLRLRDRLVSIHEAAASRPQSGDQPAGDAADLRVILTSGEPLLIRPVAFGRDWLSADIVPTGGANRPDLDGGAEESAPRHSPPLQCVLPLAAIAQVLLTRQQVRMSLGQRSAKPAASPSLSERLGLVFVLRDLCRRRSALELVLVSPSLAGARSLAGTIDRVGHDHLDLAVHEPDTPRRESLVSSIRIVPLDQLLFVRLTG